VGQITVAHDDVTCQLSNLPSLFVVHKFIRLDWLVLESCQNRGNCRCGAEEIA
jgi:hypothetical protein